MLTNQPYLMTTGFETRQREPSYLQIRKSNTNLFVVNKHTLSIHKVWKQAIITEKTMSRLYPITTLI